MEAIVFMLDISMVKLVKSVSQNMAKWHLNQEHWKEWLNNLVWIKKSGDYEISKPPPGKMHGEVWKKIEFLL